MACPCGGMLPIPGGPEGESPDDEILRDARGRPAHGGVPRHRGRESAPAHTDEGDLAEKIVGTWELVSYKVEDKETGALIDAMGSAPRGRVIFTQDGWVAFNLEGTDRRPAETDADRAALMKTLVAYIGRYRIEGDQWITHVQTAWAPEWVNTEQRRSITLHGDEADVMTPWRIMPELGCRPAVPQHHPVPARPLATARAGTGMPPRTPRMSGPSTGQVIVRHRRLSFQTSSSKRRATSRHARSAGVFPPSAVADHRAISVSGPGSLFGAAAPNSAAG